MIYEPDFVRKLCLLLFILCVVVVVFVGLQKMACLDAEGKPEKPLYRISPLSKALLCIICSVVISADAGWRLMLPIRYGDCISVQGIECIGKIALVSLVAACLLAATIMDVETHMVYDYIWWIGGGGAVLLLCSVRPAKEIWIELLLFVLLQELLFARMYGRADCHAFGVCAVLESGFGMGMEEYLVHMLFSFLILAVVQLVKGNVGRNGNLKMPVAFLPYITVGCWLAISICAVRF